MTFENDSTEGLRSEINVTPLVDVMLVLLVIFMVVTPLIHQELRVDLPAVHSGEDVNDPGQVHLTATADGGLLLNDAPLTRAELDTALRSLYATRTDHTIFLQADVSLTYAAVVDLMDACRLAGIERVGVITRPLADRK